MTRISYGTLELDRNIKTAYINHSALDWALQRGSLPYVNAINESTDEAYVFHSYLNIRNGFLEDFVSSIV
jgi:hypothetical protein